MSALRIDGVQAYPRTATGSLVAIGNFDGVHRGHQAVLGSALGHAQPQGLEPVVLTFHPHPSEVLGRGGNPLLTTIERKVELISRLDANIRVVVEPFTVELSKSSPEDFARELLVSGLGAKRVMVGQNFRFGHQRAGDLEALKQLGSRLGFDAGAEPLCGDDEGTFSSSRVRELVAEGAVERAEGLLGRPHSVCGVVVEGDRRGRTIGFPTANLGEVAEVLPAHGVYACLVDAVTESGGRALARAVANLGTRPTVNAGFSVEVHLLDFAGDLYGRRLRVHFVARLRAERRFDGIAALKAQIERDAQQAREIVVRRSPDPGAAGAWA